MKISLHKLLIQSAFLPTKIKGVVFYQLCHSSLVIPVLSLAIPGLSLAILGLSLLVQSQFQDVLNSSRLTFYQQYINSYNKLKLQGQYLIHENFLFMCKRCQKSYLKKGRKNTEVNKCMLIFQADQDSETDYCLNVYYNTESRASTKKILNL